MTDRPAVLVPIRVLEGESIPEGVPELLADAHVVLLGYHVVPDQTATGQARMQFEVWNNAIMELGGVACEKTPDCDGAQCPWREWCSAYQSGDFTAPDVPTQPEFEGSRRQMRGRVISVLNEYDELPLDDLGPRVRVDYAPEGEYGREWLRGLLSDLEDDGLVTVTDGAETALATLSRT